MFKTLLVSLLLVGTVHAAPLKIMVQPSDRVESVAGYDAQIQPVTETDPVKSVRQQAKLQGPVILWAGAKQQWAQTVANFPTLITEAAKYPGKFPAVYLYDEAGWCDSLCWFDHEDTVLQGAALAHSVGIKTVVTILPDVILDPRFNLKDINAFDGISIDVYPSIRPTEPDFKGCKFSNNNLENLFYCAAQKLRAKGFTGKIGYIYQAFGLTGETDAQRIEYLTRQKQAINNAEAMGADFLIPWGGYLGTGELEREPNLVPFFGTKFECFVKP